jgi:hypothetical protein
MLTANEFLQLAQMTGEPVTFTQTKPPQATIAVPYAILSSLSKAAEPIVNAFGISGFSIQVPAALFAVPPEKFDVIVDTRGKRHVVEHVVLHTARGSGAPVSYTLYSKGH